MNSFLASLKADLLDRRVLPIVALVGAGLLAAIAYAVLGGSSTPSAPPPVATLHATPGIAVSESREGASAAVAETTSGATVQRAGSARDPFELLPGSATASTTSTSAVVSRSSSASSASGASSGSSSSGSPSSSSGSSSPSSSGSGPGASSPSKSTPAKKVKPVPLYAVSVAFGVITPGTPPGSAQLTPFSNLRLLAPLPSSKQPLVVFRGVRKGGKEAVFTLIGEAILHGDATCSPSPSQCQELLLQTGQGEQLEYLGPTGEIVTYELRLVSIASTKAASAKVRSRLASMSRAGLRLLRHAGLLLAPGLHPGGPVGVVALATPAPRATPAPAALAVG